MDLTFETSRLRALEASSAISPSDLSQLLQSAVELLTPAVVAYLPPDFQQINTVVAAERWFNQLVSESRLFLIEHRATSTPIGFLFAHSGPHQEAHIGYLLGEAYWGQGFAGELLQGFIGLAVKEQRWHRLIAGVDPSNHASVRLLTKLGFVAQPASDTPDLFYAYPLP